MLDTVIAAVRDAAKNEIMPRFIRVRHKREADRSVFTEADIAAQEVIVKRLADIANYPVIAEEMTENEQVETPSQSTARAAGQRNAIPLATQ